MLAGGTRAPSVDRSASGKEEHHAQHEAPERSEGEGTAGGRHYALGRHKGKSYIATIVEAKDLPAGRALRSGEQLFDSLSAAGKAITGPSVNGWRFWQLVENGTS